MPLLDGGVNEGYYNGTLSLNISTVPSYCLGVRDAVDLDGYWTVPFEITFDLTSSSATSSATVVSSTAIGIAAGASSSAAALAYDDGNAQAAHDKTVGLGVGLGLAFPIVVAASAAAVWLLCFRRRRRDVVQSSSSGTIENPVYQNVGTEQGSRMSRTLNDGKVKRTESTRVRALVEKIHNLRREEA